jgi:hypothetical protein
MLPILLLATLSVGEGYVVTPGYVVAAADAPAPPVVVVEGTVERITLASFGELEFPPGTTTTPLDAAEITIGGEEYRADRASRIDLPRARNVTPERLFLWEKNRPRGRITRAYLTVHGTDVVSGTFEHLPRKIPIWTPPAASHAPAPAYWVRVDSRGATWTHADRAYLDRYVDAVERGYRAPVSYRSGAVCVGGSCAPARRGGLFFGRRR